MAIKAGDPITAADMYGVFEILSAPTGTYGLVYTHYFGNLRLYTCCLNINGNASGAPRLSGTATSGGTNNEYLTASLTYINDGGSGVGTTHSGQLGIAVNPTANSNDWVVGNLATMS